MLHVIGPKELGANHQKVETLLGLFKIYHKFSLPSEIKDNTTFMVGEDDKRGIYGGALLYPQPNTHLEQGHEPLRDIVSAFQSRSKEVWMARVCLCIGQDSSTSPLDLINLCEDFYKSLYQEFITFRKRKRFGLLGLTLRLEDTYNTDVLHHWFYLYEIKLKNPSVGFFQGILDLPLTGRPSQKPGYTVLDFSSSKRSA